jgi:RNA polymerase sigma-70 factor (ECF subfamily)
MNQSHQELPALLATDLDCYFEQLMLVYQHRLYALALRQVGNKQDAEDIVQETFLRAHHALKNYPASRIRTLQLRQWLYKITLNVFFNFIRRSGPQLVSLDLSEDSSLLEMEDQSAGPDMEVYWREWRRELETHISILPRRYRVTVDLHYFEDLSYSEIAELLNQPPGTVKANVSRGVQLLRRALETQMNETR